MGYEGIRPPHYSANKTAILECGETWIRKGHAVEAARQ
jgi:hypothetical protein